MCAYVCICVCGTEVLEPRGCCFWQHSMYVCVRACASPWCCVASLYSCVRAAVWRRLRHRMQPMHVAGGLSGCGTALPVWRTGSLAGCLLACLVHIARLVWSGVGVYSQHPNNSIARMAWRIPPRHCASSLVFPPCRAHYDTHTAFIYQQSMHGKRLCGCASVNRGRERLLSRLL